MIKTNIIKKYKKREFYLQKVKPFIGKDIIKVIVGQRRVGKSFLLFQIMDLIKRENKKAKIVYINKELAEFDKIKNYQDLLKYIKEQTKNRKSHLFIDEIQEIDNFEKALRDLNAKGNDIYCTGSNAKLLSGELATTLSGRYIEIEVFGLSYREFLIFHKIKESEESLLQYIKYGGLPYLINIGISDETSVYGYLKSIYNTILLKDIVARYKIRNVAFLENLTQYIADNIGSLVSAKKISDFLRSQKIKISPNIVLDYLSFLENAFFIFKAQRSDIQGKKVFEVNSKYYFEDLGLRHSILSYKQIDISKILENLVFLHLKMLGYQVTVGQLNDKEIDFVAEKQNKKLYIQTAYLITEENKEREFGNLLAIQDNYPKIVVSFDSMIGKSEYKGIKQMNIRDFLTKQK